jgi:hypothetical protein
MKPDGGGRICEWWSWDPVVQASARACAMSGLKNGCNARVRNVDKKKKKKKEVLENCCDSQGVKTTNLC